MQYEDAEEDQQDESFSPSQNTIMQPDPVTRSAASDGESEMSRTQEPTDQPSQSPSRNNKDPSLSPNKENLQDDEEKESQRLPMENNVSQDEGQSPGIERHSKSDSMNRPSRKRSRLMMLAAQQERVQALQACLELTQQRRAAMQQDLTQKRQACLELTQQIEQGQERLERQQETQQRQIQLQTELTASLSKSRLQLLQVLTSGGSGAMTTTSTNGRLGGLRRLALESTIRSTTSLESDTKASAETQQSSDYCEGLRTLLETSSRFFSAHIRESLQDRNDTQALSAHIALQRQKALSGTCLDFFELSSRPDSQNQDGSSTVKTDNEAVEIRNTSNEVKQSAQKENENSSDERPVVFDPNVPLCPYELNGVCSDPACSFQHLNPRSQPKEPAVDVNEAESHVVPDLLSLPPLSLPPIAFQSQPHTAQAGTPPPVKRQKGSPSESSDASVSNSVNDATVRLEEENDGDAELVAGGSSAKTGASVDVTRPGEQGPTLVSESNSEQDTVRYLASIDQILHDDYGSVTRSLVPASTTEDGSTSEKNRFATLYVEPLLFFEAAHENKTEQAPRLSNILNCVRLGIHAGRLGVPQTWEECFSMLLGAVKNGEGCAPAPHLEEQMETLRDELKTLWRVSFGIDKKLVSSNMFSCSFYVQCILSSMCSRHEKDDQNKFASKVLEQCFKSREEVHSLHFSETINYICGAAEGVSLSINAKQQRPMSKLLAIMSFGSSVLAVLEHASNHSNQQSITFSTTQKYEELSNLFNVISTGLADIMDDDKEDGISVIDGGFSMDMQLILAPVCASSLSLACSLQQYDVAQHRISFLMNQTVSYTTKHVNYFLYSELLWSQLAQLLILFPVLSEELKTTAATGVDVDDGTTTSGNHRPTGPAVATIANYLSHLGVWMLHYQPHFVLDNCGGRE